MAKPANTVKMNDQLSLLAKRNGVRARMSIIEDKMLLAVAAFWRALKCAMIAVIGEHSAHRGVGA
jgi:hypothetical protein